MTTAPQGTVARRVDVSALAEDRGNMYGIVVMQIAVLFFVTNDMLSKLVSADLAPGQLVFVRGVFSLVLLTILLLASGQYRHYRQGLNKSIMWRSICEGFAGVLFIVGLQQLPIANVSAMILTIPLVTTAAAALLLGARVGIRRWTAILVGLCGVLAIVRPGLEGFSIYSLFIMSAVILAATRDLITRRIPKGSSLWVVAFVTMALSTLGGGVWGLSEDWAPISLQNYLFVALAALFLTVAHYAIVIAMNNGEISVVSSFRYIAMPISIFYGFVLWGDIPDPLTWLGIILILSAGIYTIFRERQVTRMQQQKARAQSVGP